jgi:hypothetical protein
MGATDYYLEAGAGGGGDGGAGQLPASTVSPTVTAVTPASGASTGGSAVLLLGQYFTGATAVSFGGTPATSFSVLFDTEILAVAPAEPVGQVNVTVTNSAGTSATSPADLFSYSSSLTNTTVALSSSAGTTTYGQALTLTATVSSGGSGTPTGSVTFLDRDGTVLGTGTLNASGVATLALTSLPAGNDLLTAVYNGDSHFAGSAASPFIQTVNGANTTTTLGSSANPAVAGTQVTLTATVASTTSGTPTGTVQFWQIDPNTGSDITLLGTGTLNGSGQATLTLSTLPAGTDDIQALYLGDGNFNSSSTTLNQLITVVPTVASLSSNSGATGGGTAVAIFGQGFTGTTAVSFGGIAATSFSVLSDTEILAVAPAEGPGQVDVRVTDNAGTSSTSPADRFTYTSTLATSSTVVSSSQPTAEYGQSVTLTATVSGSSGTPTGTVTFYDGSTLLGTGTVNASGVATLTLSSLAVGNHLITAVYGGNATYGGSAVALTQVIDSAGSNTALASSQNPAPANTPVTFTATVSSSTSGTPTGSVQFWVIDPNTGALLTLLGTGTLNGSDQATLTVSNLTHGSYLIEALYQGESNFESSFARLTQVIS